MSAVNTVKASNCGPLANFGLFPEGLAIIKTRPTEKGKKKKLKL
jgi:hypothetical protein